MKTWIQRLSSSAALDKEATSSKASPADSSCDFARIHRLLKDAHPEAEAPDGLHASIMAAVHSRVEDATARRRDYTTWFFQRYGARFAAGMAMVCILALGIGDFVRQPKPSAGPTYDGMAALNSTLAAAAAMPERIQPLGPLEEELRLLDQDIATTTQHLLSAVPL